MSCSEFYYDTNTGSYIRFKGGNLKVRPRDPELGHARGIARPQVYTGERADKGRMMGRMGIGSVVGMWSYAVDGTYIPHITWHSVGLHFLLVLTFVDPQPGELAQCT